MPQMMAPLMGWPLSEPVKVAPPRCCCWASANAPWTWGLESRMWVRSWRAARMADWTVVMWDFWVKIEEPASVVARVV